MRQKVPPSETDYTSRLAQQAVAEMLTRRAISVSKPKVKKPSKSKKKKTAHHWQDTSAADEKRAVNHNVKRLVGRVLLEKGSGGEESVMRRVCCFPSLCLFYIPLIRCNG